jgi:hypothetical protein
MGGLLSSLYLTQWNPITQDMRLWILYGSIASTYIFQMPVIGALIGSLQYVIGMVDNWKGTPFSSPITASLVPMCLASYAGYLLGQRMFPGSLIMQALLAGVSAWEGYMQTDSSKNEWTMFFLISGLSTLAIYMLRGGFGFY